MAVRRHVDPGQGGAVRPRQLRGHHLADLFGEDSYFADSDVFWAAQRAAIEQRADSYREAGWREVVILDADQPFHSWEHERRTEKQGGRVYIQVGYRGEVSIHEGYVSLKEARGERRPGEGDTIGKPARPEIGNAGQDHVDLHRHTAVRAKLATEPGTALRVAVAHIIAGSPLWSVRVEQQRTGTDAVAESVETSASETAFDARRRQMLALLGFDPEAPTITGGNGPDEGLSALFVKLLSLDDRQVLDALTIVMGETLHARSDIVDALGVHLAVDMASVWQADDALVSVW